LISCQLLVCVKSEMRITVIIDETCHKLYWCDKWDIIVIADLLDFIEAADSQFEIWYENVADIFNKIIIIISYKLY